jgi:four helix bundle protein
MAKGDDIESRLVDFAVQIIQLTDALPATRAGDHLAGQLLRSGTSPAAHYAEARGAESDRDFIHKLKICLKELNESRVWLNIVGKSKLLSRAKTAAVYKENDELCRIINASIKTSKKRQHQR